MQKRNHRINFNLNDSEFEKLESLCEMYNCTYSDFFRAVIETPVIPERFNPEINTGYVVLYPDVVNELLWQVNKIGVNINQSTKAINTVAARQFLREREIENELDNIHQDFTYIKKDIEEIKETSKALYQAVEERRSISVNRKNKS